MSVRDAFMFALNIYLTGTVITFIIWMLIVAVSRFTKKG
jgi:hypothetical protein